MKGGDDIDSTNPLLYVNYIANAIIDFATKQNSCVVEAKDDCSMKIMKSEIDLKLKNFSVSSSDNSRIPHTIVFVNTVKRAIKLAAALRDHGIVCVEYHNMLRLPVRTENLKSFKDGDVSVMVATDQAARYPFN